MKKETLPERFRWALHVIDPLPNERLLEIGCGTGVLAEQVAIRPESGHLLAIDKSQATVEKAIKRNQRLIEKGRMELLVANFLQVKPTSKSFDKIYAFNVSSLWKQAEKVLPIVETWLKPSGKFYLFYQPPYEITQQLAEEARTALEGNGFKVEKALIEKLPGVSAFCLITSPIQRN